jgi:uncharacterized lipoprotein YajG
MSIENALPEPKQYFLDLLIKVDFQVADAVFRFRDYHAAINGMAEIIALTGCQDKENIKEIATTILAAQKQQSAPIDNIVPMFTKLQAFLMQQWFSELKLGLIQTSMLTGTQAPPPVKTFSPNNTSQI